MQRPALRLVAALLTFVLGVSAQAVWDRRQHIGDVCAELLMNYQD